MGATRSMLSGRGPSPIVSWDRGRLARRVWLPARPVPSPIGRSIHWPIRTAVGFAMTTRRRRSLRTARNGRWNDHAGGSIAGRSPIANQNYLCRSMDRPPGRDVRRAADSGARVGRWIDHPAAMGDGPRAEPSPSVDGSTTRPRDATGRGQWRPRRSMDRPPGRDGRRAAGSGARIGRWIDHRAAVQLTAAGRGLRHAAAANAGLRQAAAADYGSSGRRISKMTTSER